MKEVNYIAMQYDNGYWRCVEESEDRIPQRLDVNVLKVPQGAEFRANGNFYTTDECTGELKYYVDGDRKWTKSHLNPEHLPHRVWESQLYKLIKNKPEFTDFIKDGNYLRKVGSYILIYNVVAEIWENISPVWHTSSYEKMVSISDWSSDEAKKLAGIFKSVAKPLVDFNVALDEALDTVVADIKAERAETEAVYVELTDPTEVLKLLKDGEHVEFKTSRDKGVWNVLRTTQKFNLNWLYNPDRLFRVVREKKINVDGVWMNKQQYIKHRVDLARAAIVNEVELSFKLL